MSTDVLRRASALMRERAEAAIYDSSGASTWRQETSTVLAVTVVIADDLTRPDAAHIASWDPAVALAVADWLDADAGVMERHDLDATISKAYTVALAYLQENP